MGGPHEKIRRRSRIETELPGDVRDEVDRLLIEGETYETIAERLAAQGYDISKSSVGRYGKDFLALCRRVRVVEDKSRAIASGAGEGMVLEEAASKLLTGQILEVLMAGDYDIGEKSRLVSDFARLQSSSVARERLKADYARRIRETAARVEAVEEDVRAGRKTLDADTLRRIREEIYGIVS